MSLREINIGVPKNWSSVIASQINAVASASISSTLMAAKSKWEQVAQQKLRTTRNDYILGLNATDSMKISTDGFGEPYGTLILRGKWANMLETGFNPFNMKDPGFMNSPHVKQKKKGGWYLTIPFRHTTPGSQGTAVGGQVMPNDIYAQARALRGNVQRLTGTETAYPPQTSWTGYQHVNGIYEGMVKNTKQYDKVKQNTYFTFRRVSDKSDPDSWWHPGFNGINAIDEVEPWTRDTFQKVFDYTLKQVIGG